MINATLAVGPMSPEVVEATFRYSHYNRKPLMIIASKNQIDYNGGYVNGWTTETFMQFVREMKERYVNSDVLVCRDHCGPGFNGNFDLEDTYRTIDADIEHGFDLIHIDFCHFKGGKDEQFTETKKAITYCLSKKPNILIEVGTDENEGINFGPMNLQEIEREIDFFTQTCRPVFYVVQTGSLVKEINQVGDFNKEFVSRIKDYLHTKGIKLKEHNADYLSRENLDERRNLVDAMNIAPQLGVVQTLLTLQKCLIYGVDFGDFLEEVYDGRKWEKWMHVNRKENLLLCGLIAGHYHFSSESYKKILHELNKREDIKESIMNQIMDVLHHYH